MILRLAILFSLFGLCSSDWQPNFFLGRRKGGIELVDDGSTSTSSKGFGFSWWEGYINQKIDHFNTSGNWSQRYFGNLAFAQGRSFSVAFLYLGGWGAESAARVKNADLPWLVWANNSRAAVFSLEHRFYGLSQPFANQTVQNLQYLNSRQALEDAVEFIRQMNLKYNTKWIVFGGGYSGSLALWLRQKYPNVVQGAVASSSPFLAKLDYFDYLRVVEEGLSCADEVKQAFLKLTEDVNTIDGRETISKDFDLQPKFSELETIGYNDVQNFFLNMLISLEEAVQYNGDNFGPYATGYGIIDVCDLMKNKTGYDGLVEVNKYMRTINGTDFSGTPNNYTEMVEYLMNEEFSRPNDHEFDSGARSWLWSVCTEFGYFQTTDVRENTIFGPVVPLNLYVNLCQDVFGSKYNANTISQAVAATNEHYGGARYRGTNAVITNGALDPWKSLGANTSSLDVTVVNFVMKDAAHCADQYPTTATTLASINNAHSLIAFNLDKWIMGPLSNKTLPAVSSTSTYFSQAGVLRAKRSSINRIVAGQSLSNQAEGIVKYKKIHLGRPPHGLRPAPPPTSNYPQGYENGSFYQPIDHFNNTNQATFSQRFFKNAQWAKDGGPMFLMIGGDEDGEDINRWVLNPNVTWLTYAQNVGATVYLLEHRYYGESRIGENGHNQDMSYLTSLQMIYDVENFISYANYYFGNSQPWIVFGGAYSGSLALWARERFPKLIRGAVGSSGPLQAKLDFYEYLEVVETAIRTYSRECADSIADGFTEIHTLILSNTSGVDRLNDLFQLQPRFDPAAYALSETHKQFFFSNLYGNFQGTVQYNNVNSEDYGNNMTSGIAFMCDFMLNGNQTSLENIAHFNRAMIEFYTGSEFVATENNYTAFVEHLQSGGSNNEEAAVKYWTYQTCNEFAYFQSTDLGNGIFGSPTPVNFYTQLCKDVFEGKFNGPMIESAVEKTNAFYGGQNNYRGTNVVIPNGSMDPWYPLGKYTGTVDSNSTILFINGTSNCADMFPERASDPPALKAARKTTGEFVAYWTEGGDSPPIPVNPDNPTTTPRTWNPDQSTTPKSSAVILTFLPILLSIQL